MKLKPLRSPTIIRDLNWVKSNVEHVNGCWLWTKSSSDGYGQFVHVDPKTKTSKSYRLHRYVYQMCVALVGSSDLVRHMCNNRLCCNPDHLEVGTHLDNYRDSQVTHRLSCAVRASKKYRAANATLADRTVRSYRRLYGGFRISVPDIMELSGLSRTTVLCLLEGKTYRRLGMKYVPECVARINKERYTKQR